MALTAKTEVVENDGELSLYVVRQNEINEVRSKAKAAQRYCWIWIVLWYCLAIVTVVPIFYFGFGTSDLLALP